MLSISRIESVFFVVLVFLTIHITIWLVARHSCDLMMRKTAGVGAVGVSLSFLGALLAVDSLPALILASLLAFSFSWIVVGFLFDELEKWQRATVTTVMLLAPIPLIRLADYLGGLVTSAIAL